MFSKLNILPIDTRALQTPTSGLIVMLCLFRAELMLHHEHIKVELFC